LAGHSDRHANHFRSKNIGPYLANILDRDIRDNNVIRRFFSEESETGFFRSFVWHGSCSLGQLHQSNAVLAFCIQQPTNQVPLFTSMEFRSMAAATKEKSKVKLVPLGDRIVVQREASQEKTSGGIFLPDSAKDRPTRGKIISIGDGRVLDNGSRSTLQVKVGDIVLFTSYAGENIEINGEEYLMMSENEVLAIIG
jgi:chaperonin GroES